MAKPFHRRFVLAEVSGECSHWRDANTDSALCPQPAILTPRLRSVP